MNILAAGVGAVVIILIILGGYLLVLNQEPLMLTLNMSLSQKSTTPGNVIPVMFQITSNRPIAVELNYTVVSRTGAIIISKSQSFTVQNQVSRTIAIALPPTAQPGPYWLLSKAISGGVFTSAIAGFVVMPQQIKKPVPAKQPVPKVNRTVELNKTNETSIPTEPEPEKPIPQTLSPGPAPLSIDEVITKAKVSAVKDPQAAADSCKSLQPPDLDTCYSEVALSTHAEPSLAVHSKSICLRIADTSSRDACLANLALAGDFSVCDAINNIDIKDSCNALRGTP